MMWAVRDRCWVDIKFEPDFLQGVYCYCCNCVDDYSTMMVLKVVRLIFVGLLFTVVMATGARDGEVTGLGETGAEDGGVDLSETAHSSVHSAGVDDEEGAAGVSEGTESDGVDGEAKSDGTAGVASDDSQDEDYVEQAGSRKRPRSVGVRGERGGSPRGGSGRQVKARPRYHPQKRSDWESSESEEAGGSGEEGDVGAEEEEDVVTETKGWVFPAELVPKKIGRARVVKMGLPEVLLPKGQAHSATQEYAWICNSIRDARKTADGKRMNGAWARFVEVCAGSDSEMLKQVHRETRKWERDYRRESALAKQEGVRQRMKASFINRMTKRLGLDLAVAEEMWVVAQRELVKKHGAQIDEDIAELDELMQRAEAWRVDPPTDTCGGGVLPQSPSDRGGGPSGGSGGGGAGIGLGLAVGALSATVGRRSRGGG